MAPTSNLRRYRELKSAQSFIKKIIPALALSAYLSAFTGQVLAANDTSASVMRLEKVIGDVRLTSSGTESQIIEKMRLGSGDDITSYAKSYAFISLDSSKAVKLDANSQARIEQDKNRYEVVLESGNLIFDVDKPLESNESLEIRTANMTMGIRGTCAQVERRSDTLTSVSLLEGTVKCTLTDPATGGSQTVELHPGDHADLYTGSEYTNGFQIVTRKLSLEDLRGFSQQYLIEHPTLIQKIYDLTGIDLRSLTRDQVSSRLLLDETLETPIYDAGSSSPTAEYYLHGN